MGNRHGNHRHCRSSCPWNTGKIVGQKAPFKPKDVWALRVRLQMESRVRELALLNLGIDSICLLRHGRGQAGAFVVTLPAAKAEIASQLNLTLEHFSRILHELAQAGLLQVQGRRITVPEPAGLQQATRQR